MRGLAEVAPFGRETTASGNDGTTRFVNKGSGPMGSSASVRLPESTGGGLRSASTASATSRSNGATSRTSPDCLTEREQAGKSPQRMAHVAARARELLIDSRCQHGERADGRLHRPRP